MMKKKRPFVPAVDRPEPPPVDPNTPLGELRVRDLESLLAAAYRQKPVAAEVMKRHWKLEKWEGSKAELWKDEMGKFEHGEPKGGLEAGSDPEFGRGIKDLVETVTELKSAVAQLGRQLAARSGKPK